MSSGSEGDELTTPGVPVLGINSHTPIDEVLALSAHLVAKASVDAVVREAVEELARAVAGATQWLAEAVRGELVSQAVAAAEPSESRSSVENEEEHEQPPPKELPKLDGPSTLTDRPPSAAIHAVAKAAVDAVTREAVSDIVQAVERATEWVTQAVGNELVSEAVEPEEAAALHDATEWIPEAVRVELAAHAVADAVPSSEAPTVVNEPEEFSGTLDVAVPRLAVQVGAPSVADVRALAEATAVGAVSTALQNITRALGDASTWLAQAVRGELLAQAVVDASPDDGRQADEADNNSTSLEEPSQPPPSTEAVDTVPALRIPPAAAAAECHELAVPFINEVVSSALHQAVPATPLAQDEPQEYADDAYEDYTPINSPTTNAAPSKSPVSSARSPAEDTSAVPPPAILSGRATPPDTTPASRRRSPITSKRGLGTPTSKESSPSSAPSATPSPRFVDEAAIDCSGPEPAHSALPPLVLPAAQLTSRGKPHKTPRKTPRQSSHRAFSNPEAAAGSASPRATTTSSSRLDKHTSRSSLTAEFELTPLSSARAAALIYAQQPPSSRRNHHHHKPKKLRDTASQTSPPPSPSLSSLPREPLVGAHDGSELPKAQHSKHSSPRDLSSPSPEKSTDKRVDGGNNVLLAPLAKTPAMPASADSSSKTSSPSRTHKKHGHGHSHKGTGGGPSPNKRTGYCQRCVFEGRTCRINDCLKHQVLK